MGGLGWRGGAEAEPCCCNPTRRDILSSIPPPAPHDSGHFCFVFFLHFLPSCLSLEKKEKRKKVGARLVQSHGYGQQINKSAAVT